MSSIQPAPTIMGEIGRILVFEPARAKGNPTIILALVSALLYFGILGVYIGRYAEEITEIATSMAHGMEQASQSVIGRWLQDATDPAVRTLFQTHSVVLGCFCWFALLGAPWLAMLVGSDQTSSEFARRHIRFVLPRVSRRGLFLARFTGAWLTWTLISSASVIVIGLILAICDPGDRTGGAPVLLVRVVIALAVYGMPFIAIMAFINTFISNPFVACLTASGIYSLIGILGWMAGWIDETYTVVTYLEPGTVKYPLLSVEAGRFAAGVTGAFAYTLLFLGLGDWVLRSRDT